MQDHGPSGWGWELEAGEGGLYCCTCELHKHPPVALKPSLDPSRLHLGLFVTPPMPCWPQPWFLFPLFLSFCHSEFWFQSMWG